MFKRSNAERRGDAQKASAVAEPCPKCGSTEVVADYCQRCRVKVSTYQAYLSTLGKGALQGPGRKRRWLGRLRLLPRSHAAPPANWRSGYEDGLLRKIYRELRYPATTRGVYLVMVSFHLTAGGRPVSLHLTVDPSSPEVAQSVRSAVNRAQPFPLPPAGGHDERITLTLTVSI
jgi:TonB family protein